MHHRPMQVRFLPSPHCDARPEGVGVDLIVLHAISLPPGEFEPVVIEDFFMGRLDVDSHPALKALEGMRVSAHFVVDRQGKITQFVPAAMRAWHAGVSSWQGRQRCNDFALGIEMIGDEEHPFTPAQYREAARLCRVLINRFPGISPERIVGHADIAPGRKWDPGRQWDWGRFRRSLSRIRNLDLEIEI